MRVLKAYANQAQQAQNQPWAGSIIHHESSGAGQAQISAQKEQKKSGDTLSLSDEARQMLNQGENLSVCAQDATYDKNGYIMRQVENLQGDLRSLATNLLGTPGGAALAGQVKGLQTQLGSISAQV